MKSVVHENSTIAKAIEQAWNKAGCPEQFFIKILEHPTTKKFWMFGSAQNAKVALFFEEKQGTIKKSSDSLLEQKEYKHLFDELKQTDFDLMSPSFSKKQDKPNHQQRRHTHHNRRHQHGKQAQQTSVNSGMQNQEKQADSTKQAHVNKSSGGSSDQQQEKQGQRRRRPYRGRRFNTHKNGQSSQTAEPALSRNKDTKERSESAGKQTPIKNN